ncbi:MAG: hypothetical protein QOD75_2606 [Blastocatellia bacterium]|jgi:hypothetical protein|nr:hypothetical protein [Blastocatellia bacterium]
MVTQEQYVVDSKGRKTGVLLSLRQYEKLLEDLHDLAMVAERRNEESISLEELKRRLKKMACYRVVPKPSVERSAVVTETGSCADNGSDRNWESTLFRTKASNWKVAKDSIAFVSGTTESFTELSAISSA